MSDSHDDVELPVRRFIKWWRSLTSQEKVFSTLVLTGFFASVMTFPLGPFLQDSVIGWLILVSSVAGFLVVSLPVIKVLGQLTGANDFRWKQVIWWEVLLLLTLVHNNYLAEKIIGSMG